MRSNLVREAFSERLRDALADAGLPNPKPGALAREFNRRYPGDPVTGQAARKWLQGDAIPEQSRLQVLAQWLGVSTEWLRYGEAQSTALDTREASPAVDYALMRDYARLSPSQQLAVRALIKNLLREGTD